MKTSLAYLAARIGPAVLGLATVATLTRLLSAQAYGDYALVMASAGIVNALLFTWNAQALFRSYSARTDPRPIFAAGVFGYGLSLGFMILIVLVGAPLLMGSFPPILIISGAALAAAYAWLELASYIFNVQQRTATFVIFQTARAGITLIVGAAIAWTTGSGALLALGLSFAWLLMALIPAFGGWAFGASRQYFDRRLIAQSLRYGAPLAFAIALTQLLGSLDRFMIAGLSGSKAVGEYAVGYDLAQFAIGAVGGALSLSFYPDILRELDQHGPEAARSRLAVYSVWQAALVLPLSVGFALTSPAIARLLIGPELRAGALQVMPWICATAVFATVKTFYADFSFQIGRWTTGGAITASVALAANAGLNVVLIPRLGALGAAQASLVSTALALGLAGILGRSHGFRLPGFGRDHAKIALATLVMALSLWPLHSRESVLALTVEVGIGVATYSMTALLLDIAGSRRIAIGLIMRPSTRGHDPN